MERTYPNVFLLKARDPETASITLEARFEAKDRDELRAILRMPADELTGTEIYNLDAARVAKIVHHYRLSFDPGDMPTALHAWHPIDDLPYKVHTERELALMLTGTKPLAAFAEEYPNRYGINLIPEREFAPFVAAGRIRKRELIEFPATDFPSEGSRRTGIRHVLYALADEVWRIDAYFEMWETGRRTGWSEDLERRQGSLLGYEDWQNDYHIEHRYRRIASP